MSDQYTEIERLLERSRQLEMTYEQRAAQRRSFAYGNSAFENPRITKEMVDEAAKRMGF